MGRYRRLEVLYQISPAMLGQMLALQGWRCAICGVNFRSLSRKARHIDHSHVTGRARSVLCASCNTGLGMFRDDPAILRSAARYLDRHREPELTGVEYIGRSQTPPPQRLCERV